MRTIRLINHGGFGEVDEVELDDGTRVARKKFRAPAGADAALVAQLKRRFVREVRVQRSIKHANIMPILEADLVADPPWFTMPLATKSYLDKLSADRAAGTLDPEPWEQILAGVEELHRRGYVHRDLKPENILLLDTRWVVSDLGLVLPTMRDTTILTTRLAFGTGGYMAPEQAADFGHTPDEADIWALGCILHDMSDPNPNRLPYHQVLARGPLAEIIKRCTEKEPEDRFRTVSALRDVLLDALANAIAPPPPGDIAERVRRAREHLGDRDEWRSFVAHLDDSATAQEDRHFAMRSIDVEALDTLNTADFVTFNRLVGLLCRWAGDGVFDFGYVDVVGDRLVHAYGLARVGPRCAIILAALELAVSHNRWRLMGQVGTLLNGSADPGVIDNLLHEFNEEVRLRRKLRRIEDRSHWSRASWHPAIRSMLDDDPDTEN